MHRLHTLDMQIETETQTAIGKITLILFGHENQEEKKVLWAHGICWVH